MKQPTRNILLSIVVILLITGCKKTDIHDDTQQRILFQYDHVCETQHYGFILDNEGNIYTYNNPENWNFPDKDFEISLNQAEKIADKCVFSGKKIQPDELMKYAKCIEHIAMSKVTAPRNTGSDEGITQYICYQFSESSQTYSGHLIKTEGDVTRENLNFHSKRVSSWMREIGEVISFE
jgi:hypothetical protein